MRSTDPKRRQALVTTPVGQQKDNEEKGSTDPKRRQALVTEGAVWEPGVILRVRLTQNADRHW